MRKPNDDWVKRCQSFEVVAKTGRGRGKKSWFEGAKRDVKDVSCVWMMPKIMSYGKVFFDEMSKMFPPTET